MTPDTWKEIGRIVEQALSLQGAEREQFLQQAFLASPNVRGEVEAMLAAHEADETFLETPALEGLRFNPGTFEDEQIGSYKLIRQIGQGGMGNVYLAHREGVTGGQPVALKVIRKASEDVEVMLVRFQVEQQILSELVHPNIARLLDAGVTEAGRPYFVMEYVDGLPINTFADRHKLSVEERLRLFVQACKAVQFAHQNLIVHGNICRKRKNTSLRALTT